MVIKKAHSADDIMEEDNSKTSRSSRRGVGVGGFGWIRGAKAAARRAKETVDAKNDQTPKTSNSAASKAARAVQSPNGLLPSTPSLDSAAAVPSTPMVQNSKAANTLTTTTPSTPAGILKKPSKRITKSNSNNSNNSNNNKPKTSWFCRTAMFHRMCDSAFDAIDADYSGTIDETELYSGLLLIHLKLGTYAGPAACRPLSRDRCRAVFQKMDLDGSQTLDKREFANVMAVLFGNVVSRVFVQWFLTLMIVPWVAQGILSMALQTYMYIVTFVQNLDEHSDVANTIELTVEDVGEWCLAHTPLSILSTSSRVAKVLAMVPESVWKAVPLTLLSTILGLLVVPYCIFQVDDFFQRLADRKVDQRNKRQ